MAVRYSIGTLSVVWPTTRPQSAVIALLICMRIFQPHITLVYRYKGYQLCFNICIL